LHDLGTPATSRSRRPGDTLAMLAAVLLSSGNPVYLYPEWPELVLLPAAVVFLVALLIRDELRVQNRDLLIFTCFTALLALHLLTVPGATVFASAGFLVRLFLGYAAFRLVADAPRTLLEILAVIAALAVAVYAVDQLLLFAGFDLAEFVAPVSVVHGDFEHVSTALHNFPGGIDRHRNSGLFWEPGALSGYSLLGLLLLAFLPERLPRPRMLAIVLVLSLAVISTQSTTGYLLLPLALFLLFVRLSGARGGGFVALGIATVVPLLVAVALAAYQLPFMGEKIESQIRSVQVGEGEWELTRLGTLLNDVKDISERPLAGWGANPLIRPSQQALSETARMTQGNGFANWIVRFGLTGLLIFLLALAAGLRQYSGASRFQTWLAVGIVCLLLQGEAFLNYPLFLGLMFIVGAPVARRYWVVQVEAAQSRPTANSAIAPTKS
jgi:hypothetical protein